VAATDATKMSSITSPERDRASLNTSQRARGLIDGDDETG
jgi:hypothetical protein